MRTNNSPNRFDHQQVVKNQQQTKKPYRRQTELKKKEKKNAKTQSTTKTQTEQEEQQPKKKKKKKSTTNTIGLPQICLKYLGFQAQDTVLVLVMSLVSQCLVLAEDVDMQVMRRANGKAAWPGVHLVHRLFSLLFAFMVVLEQAGAA